MKVARDVYVQERGLWSTVEKQVSRIINIRLYREYSFESVLVCLYILNSPFLSSFVAVNKFMRPLTRSLAGFKNPLGPSKRSQSASFSCSLSSYRLMAELLGRRYHVDVI